MSAKCIAYFLNRVLLSLLLLFAIGACYFENGRSSSLLRLRVQEISERQATDLKVAAIRDIQEELQQDDLVSGKPAIPEHADGSKGDEEKSDARNEGSTATNIGSHGRDEEDDKETVDLGEKQAEVEIVSQPKVGKENESKSSRKKRMNHGLESQSKQPKADERQENEATPSAVLEERLEISQRLSRVIQWQADHAKNTLSVKKTELVLPHEFHEGMVVPGYFTFSIVAKDLKGRPRTGCSDTFFVTISSDIGVCSAGTVTCELNNAGRHEVRAILPSAGKYKVNVTAIGTVASSLCFDLNEENGLLATLSVTVKSPPKRGGAVAASATSTCSAEAFYDGFYSMQQCVERSLFQSKGEAFHTWYPYGALGGEAMQRCDWPAYWSLERLQGSLGGKWIVFVGDSTLEEIAVLYYLKFYGAFNESWNSPRCNCNSTKFVSQRIWDTGYVSPDLPRLSFYWIGDAAPCKNGGGLLALQDDAVRHDLRALFGDHFLTPSSHRCEKRVHLLVFNSGLHDLMHQMPFDFPAYLARLDVALGNFSNIAHRTVWKTISPKLRSTTCRLSIGSQAHVAVLNAHATPLARSHGFQIADQDVMSVALFNKSDGHHCRRGEPCQAFASSLLNFIAPVLTRNSVPPIRRQAS